MTRLACILLAMFLCGCQHPVPAPKPPVVAESKVDTITTTREQEAAAHVAAAKQANANAPASPAKAAVDGSLTTAQTLLPTPTPEQIAEAVKPVVAALSGNLDRATELWGKAQANAAELQTKLDQAKAEREAERLANTRALEKLQKDHAAAVADERAKAENKVLAQQVHYLNIAGGAFALGFGLCVAFGGLALLQRGAWVLGLFALLAFGLAQIVGAWWFKWAILLSVLVAAGVFAWYSIKHKSAAAGLQALQPVVKTLDDAYDNAMPELKVFLDEKVFGPLSSLMDKAQKATVHEVRKS